MLYYNLQPIVSSFNEKNACTLDVRKGMDDLQCHIISKDLGKVIRFLRKHIDNSRINKILKKYPMFYRKVCASDFFYPSLFVVSEDCITKEKDVLFLLKEEDFAFYFDILQDFVLLKAELENEVACIYEKHLLNQAKVQALDDLSLLNEKRKKIELIRMYKQQMRQVNRKKKQEIKKVIKEIKKSSNDLILKRINAERINLIRKSEINQNTEEISYITTLSGIIDSYILFFENMLDMKEDLLFFKEKIQEKGTTWK